MASNARTLSQIIKTNTILEDYDVKWKQKLGCGISGPVRPCKKKSTGESFALKCLVDRPRARQEILLQIRCTGHPNIVNIYDVYANEVQFPGEPQTRSRLLVVMELMDGGELFDRISKQKCFTEKQAARYAAQAALSIQRCHSLGIAHRDIKPENLLLKDNSEDAVIKLSDFGFAKEDDGNLMTPHFTPYYVAPQVLEAQKQKSREQHCLMTQTSPYTYDRSCDMWSLGVIIYIMLCGYPPFYSETPSKQLTKLMRKKILAGHYEFPEDDWAHVSPHARDLVTRLLKVNPEERLTVEQVLEHPWLSQAPNTELQSPAVMMDKGALYEAQQAHSEQLTALRLPDNMLTLKPLKEINNPILKKRQQASIPPSLDCRPECFQPQEPSTKQKNSTVATHSLRDVIAHCILPPKDEERDQDGLIGLLQQAQQHTVHYPKLPSLLYSHGWNGEQFDDKVDRQRLAHDLSEMIRQKDIVREYETTV